MVSLLANKHSWNNSAEMPKIWLQFRNCKHYSLSKSEFISTLFKCTAPYKTKKTTTHYQYGKALIWRLCNQKNLFMQQKETICMRTESKSLVTRKSAQIRLRLVLTDKPQRQPAQLQEAFMRKKTPEIKETEWKKLNKRLLSINFNCCFALSWLETSRENPQQNTSNSKKKKKTLLTIIKVTFQEKMSNIWWFWFLKCDVLQLDSFGS